MSDHTSTPSFGRPWLPAQTLGQEYSQQPTMPDVSNRLINAEEDVPQHNTHRNHSAFLHNSGPSTLNTHRGSPVMNSSDMSRNPEAQSRYQLPGLAAQNDTYVPFFQHGHQSLDASAAQQRARTVVTPQHPSPSLEIEEGELSEGEFQDGLAQNTYQTTIDHFRPGLLQSLPQMPHRALPTLPAFAMDVDAEYHPTQPLLDAYGRSSALNRQRSESYSPQPAEPPYSLRTPSEIRRDQHPSDDGDAEVETQERDRGQRLNDENFTEDEYTPQESFASAQDNLDEGELQEARRKAQEAIINLIPFKIQFQDYTEEGIDPDVIRHQFQTIGLPLGLTLTEERDSIVQMRSVAANGLSQGTNAAKIEGEARKDRIARLLAEKMEKLASSQTQAPSSAAAFETNNPHLATPPSANAAKADKERLLRLKMDALQKSREQRAQKAAVKPSNPSPILPSAVETSANVQDPGKNAGDDPQLKPQAKKESRLQLAVAEPGILETTRPSIPGLFLSTNSDIIARSEIIAPSTSYRKRPVASDFDDLFESASSNKRPFGQSRLDQPLVIDVSDDESDDGFGANFDVQSHESSARPLQNGSSQFKTSIRDHPPLSDFPTRKIGPSTSSTVRTPPRSLSQTKSAATGPRDLQEHQLQIDNLKKLIAEKEAEKERRELAKQSSTDGLTSAVQAIGDLPQLPIAETTVLPAVVAAFQIEQLIDDATRQIDKDQQKLDDARTNEQREVDDLISAEADRRRLRKAKIVSDLPIVDAKVEANQRRLAQLRAEMAQLEAAVQEGLDQKQMLAKELDELGCEADEQLQVHKSRLADLQRDEESKIGETDEPTRVSALSSTTAASADHLLENVHVIPQTLAELPTIPDFSYENTRLVSDKSLETEEVTQNEDILNESSGQSVAPSSPNLKPQSSMKVNMDQAIKLHLSLSPQVDVEEGSEDTSESGMEQRYAPDPSELAPASPNVQERYQEIQEKVDRYLTSNETAVSTEHADVEDGSYEAGNKPVSSLSPSEPVCLSIVLENAQGRDFDQSAMAPPASYKPQHSMATETNGTGLSLLSRRGSQDIAPDYNGNSVYSKYESPLKYFRAYRFHPNFLVDIPGGFKSLTYSNDINPMKELCRFELAGGVCNDATCEFQHFKTMGLSDDLILMALGNTACYSDKETPRFVAGLRNILQEMNDNKVRDFDTIASGIAAYRSAFSGDESNIMGIPLFAS